MCCGGAGVAFVCCSAGSEMYSLLPWDEMKERGERRWGGGGEVLVRRCGVLSKCT